LLKVIERARSVVVGNSGSYNKVDFDPNSAFANSRRFEIRRVWNDYASWWNDGLRR
jgi:hypothetical protein